MKQFPQSWEQISERAILMVEAFMEGLKQLGHYEEPGIAPLYDGGIGFQFYEFRVYGSIHPKKGGVWSLQFPDKEIQEFDDVNQFIQQFKKI